MDVAGILERERERAIQENKLKIANIDLRIAEYNYRMAWPRFVLSVVKALAELTIAIILFLYAAGKL